MTPEQRAERGRKISATKTGRKHRDPAETGGPGAGGARVLTTEQIAGRTAAVREAWSAKTPEERAAHAAKIKEAKRVAREG